MDTGQHPQNINKKNVTGPGDFGVPRPGAKAIMQVPSAQSSNDRRGEQVGTRTYSSGSASGHTLSRSVASMDFSVERRPILRYALVLWEKVAPGRRPRGHCGVLPGMVRKGMRKDVSLTQIPLNVTISSLY